MHLALVLSAGLLLAADQTTDTAAAPSVCYEPAVKDLKIVCDRWPDAMDLRQFGLDAIRIEGAKTEEAKCLAVWRWMRRCAMKTDGRGAHEAGRFVDSWKILNVYGAEQCGGLSLLVTDIWRALGYRAARLYRHGHTLADCFYVDTDGVGRYHMLDNNYGWFVSSRDGGHILTAEEIGADFSTYDIPSRTHVPWIDKKMWMWGWCHMIEMSLPRPKTMTLHHGETVERLWGNLGKPYLDNVGVREWDQEDQPPYERKFGNGVVLTGIGFDEHWRGQLALPPVNVTVKDGRLVQVLPQEQAGEIVCRVESPYIVADGLITLNATGNVVVETDRGTGWVPIKPGVSYVEQGLKGAPIGRYGYLVRVRLIDGATLSAVLVKSIVQLNSLSLPSLLAGENKITITGTLDRAKKRALVVKYVWDDLDGKARTHEAHLTTLPATYTIAAAGKTWKDVVCRSVSVYVMTDSGPNKIQDLPKPSVMPAGPLPSADVRTVIGPNAAPAFKTTAEYLVDLKSDSADVRRLAAEGLTAKPDPAAWDALVKIAQDDTTVAKICAVQALFWTDRKKAVPVLRAILKKDPAVKFEPRNDELATYGNVAGTIAAMCGLTKFNELVPELCEADAQIGKENRWGLIRALGRINDPRGFALIRRYVQSYSDDTPTVANEWAGRVGDKEAIPFLAKWLDSKRYPIRTLRAIESLGTLGAEGHTDKILDYLDRNRNSEDVRAGCADALAKIGDPAKCIPVLEKLLAAEQFPWVRERLSAALAQLKSRAR